MARKNAPPRAVGEKNAPYPQDIVDRALDRCAEIAANNKGVLPKGSFSVVGDEFGVSNESVRQWWYGYRRTDGDMSERIAIANANRAVSIQVASEKLPALLDHLSKLALDDDSTRNVAAAINAINGVASSKQSLDPADEALEITITRIKRRQSPPPPPTIDAIEDEDDDPEEP